MSSQQSGDIGGSGREETGKSGKSQLRKPYVLTKQREPWSPEEHVQFIHALQLYNRDWKKIEEYVGTKTVVQIRSHAQKWFQKNMKSGNTDAVPPPRPKRKTSENPNTDGQPTEQGTATISNSDGVQQPRSSAGKSQPAKTSGGINKSKSKDSSCSSPTNTKDGTQLQNLQQLQAKQQRRPSLGAGPSAGRLAEDSVLCNLQSGPPNLYLVYSYLGSLFDPKFEGCDHLQALSNMQASDRVLSVELIDTLAQSLSAQCTIKTEDDMPAGMATTSSPPVPQRAGRRQLPKQGSGSAPERTGSDSAQGARMMSPCGAAAGPSGTMGRDGSGQPGSSQATATALAAGSDGHTLAASKRGGGRKGVARSNTLGKHPRQEAGRVEEDAKPQVADPQHAQHAQHAQQQHLQQEALLQLEQRQLQQQEREEAMQAAGELEMDMASALAFFEPSMGGAAAGSGEEFQEGSDGDLLREHADRQRRPHTQGQGGSNGGGGSRMARPPSDGQMGEEVTGRERSAGGAGSGSDVVMGSGADGSADMIVRIGGLGIGMGVGVGDAGAQFCEEEGEEGRRMLCDGGEEAGASGWQRSYSGSGSSSSGSSSSSSSSSGEDSDGEEVGGGAQQDRA